MGFSSQPEGQAPPRIFIDFHDLGVGQGRLEVSP
jgi:hypothetical protein